MGSKKRIYKVVFMNEGEVWEVYCKSVGQGELFGFVEIEDLLFGQRSSVVVDPTEEKVKNEFAGVTRTHLPMHAVLRIDEVDQTGTARIHAISDQADKIARLPTPIYTPSKNDS